MSSDIKERLRVADVGEAFIGQHGVECVQTELGLEAADRIEALEAEVAAYSKLVEKEAAFGIAQMKRAKAAEARAERLREALATIGEGIRDGQHCALIANTALEDDKQ